MGVPTGRYSKGPSGGFVEEKRHLMGLVQRRIPWVDADENRKEAIRFNYIRRGMQVLLDSSSPNDGFKCSGDGASNDFKIAGGPSDPFGGGRIWVGGYPCLLIPDIRYVNNGSSEGKASIYARVTAVGSTFIEDSSANYVVNELAGRVVTPDVTTPGTTFTITSNTATRITVAGNPLTSGIVVGNRYRLELTTPAAGPSRSDAVYLNVYLDEVSGAKDPSILNNIGTPLETQRFLQVIQTIFVREDVTGVGELPSTYTDADGNEHHTLKIATLTRPGAQAAINIGNVTDLRKTSGDLTAFVRKIGDTMTGNLTLNGGNVVMAGAETVDGRDLSVDGTKLDSIDFTGAGIASHLKMRGQPVQGTDLIGVTGSSANVSDNFRGATPGGGDGVAGVVTTPPYNLVKIKTKLGRDDIEDANGDPVYGRLVGPNSLALTGTLTFTNASNSVTGSGTSFLSQLQVGDIITRDDDGRFVTVATIPSNTLLTTVLGEAWPGTTGSGASTRQRWVLSFFSQNDSGAEIAYTFTPTDLSWAFLQVFPLHLLPVFPVDWVFPSNQVAGDMPYASHGVAGKVLLANANEALTDAAVRADDPRVTTPISTPGKTRKAKIVINGTGGTSVAVDDTDPDSLTFTVSSSVVGGSFPGFGAGTPTADSVSGAQGSSGLVSRFDHSHPFAAEYARLLVVGQNTVGPGASLAAGDVIALTSITCKDPGAIVIAGGSLNTGGTPTVAIKDGSSNVLNVTDTLVLTGGSGTISFGLVGFSVTKSAKVTLTGTSNPASIHLLVVGLGPA